MCSRALYAQYQHGAVVIPVRSTVYLTVVCVLELTEQSYIETRTAASKKLCAGLAQHLGKSD